MGTRIIKLDIAIREIGRIEGAKILKIGFIDLVRRMLKGSKILKRS